MFIKFWDHVKLSVPFFTQIFLSYARLKNYGKNMGNFPGFPKYDGKHWASVVKSQIKEFANTTLKKAWPQCGFSLFYAGQDAAFNINNGF